MKIALMIPSLEAGGAERVISVLANQWSREGHIIYLYVFSDKCIFYNINSEVNLKIVDLQGKIGRFSKAIFLLKVISILKNDLKRNKIQCLISFTTFLNCFAIFASKIVGIPVIISERTDPLYHGSVSLFTAFLRKLIYCRAQAIVLQTEHSVISFQNGGIKLPKRSFIIFNPISDGFTNLAMERKEVILSVGRLTKEKGHDLLLRAFSKLSITSWELWILGEGPLLTQLIALSVELGISDNVKFLGKKSNISDYYNIAPIFVLPSRVEGFPNALCEAMACGCGVISFDCPNGPSEIIEDGINGLLVENGDTIQLSKGIATLINDRDLLERISKEAVKIIDSLNVKSIGNKWLELIDSVVSKVDNK